VAVTFAPHAAVAGTAGAGGGGGSGAGTPSLAPSLLLPPHGLPWQARGPGAPEPRPGPSPPASPDGGDAFTPLGRARVALDAGGGGSGAGAPPGCAAAPAAQAAAAAAAADDDDAWDAMSRSSEDGEEAGDGGGEAAAVAAVAAALAAAASLRPPAPLRPLRVVAADLGEALAAASPPAPPGLTPRAAAAAAAVGPLLARLRAIQGDGPRGGSRTPPPAVVASGVGGSEHGGAAAWAALNGGGGAHGPPTLPPLTRRASSLSPRAAASAARSLRTAAVAALQQAPARSPLGSATTGGGSPFAWRAGQRVAAAGGAPPAPPPARSPRGGGGPVGGGAASRPVSPPRRLVLTPAGPPPGASLFGVAAPRPLPSGPPREAGRLALTRVGGTTWLNGYMVLKFLGAGAYGRVYLVMDGADQALYAAKVVRTGCGGGASRADPAADAARRAADFRREAALMTRAHHPGVVPLREVLHDPARGRALLLMDYCEGGPVLSRADLEGGARLPEAVARGHFASIAAALAFLHARRILHGDIKPENVLLTAAGGAVLSDFGCSRLMRPLKECGVEGRSLPGQQPHQPNPHHLLSCRGSGGGADVAATGDTTHATGPSFLDVADDLVDKCVAGTPAFLAPEQCRPGAKYRGRPADVWALGVTLYAWVTGRLPFGSAARGGGGGDGGQQLSAAAALFASIQGDPLRFPPAPLLSPPLRDLLTRMLVKDPGGRARLEEVLAHPWVAGGGGRGDAARAAAASASTPASTPASASTPARAPRVATRTDHLAAHLATPSAARVEFEDGAVMLRQGDPGGHAYFLLAGAAEVVVKFPPAASGEGGGSGNGADLPPAVAASIRRASRLARALRRGDGSYVVALRAAGQFVGEVAHGSGGSAGGGGGEAGQSGGAGASPPSTLPRRFASVIARGRVSALVVPAPALYAVIATVPAARQQARELAWARDAELLVLDAVVRLSVIGGQGGGGRGGGGGALHATP